MRIAYLKYIRNYNGYTFRYTNRFVLIRSRHFRSVKKKINIHIHILIIPGFVIYVLCVFFFFYKTCLVVNLPVNIFFNVFTI
jgi:hypothetical protein